MKQAKKASRVGIWVVGLVYAAALCCLLLYLIAGWSGAGVDITDGLLGVGGVLSLAGIGLSFLWGLIYLRSLGANSESMVADLRRLMSGQTQNEAILTQVSENLLLSDAIKSVAFREKDQHVLEEAIRQDIRREKWDSANRLIDELEKRFACRQKAEELREEIKQYCNASREEKIDSCIKSIENLWLIHHYDQAEKEVEELLRLYPDSPRVQELRDKTGTHRQQHKMDLLERWDKVVKSNDVDQGVEILKLMDQYLTPSEAAALKESARGVVLAKLHNMGVKFSLFVTENKWQQALNIGKQIIDEYPNSRMAQEVRERLDVLEQRAAQQSA